MKKYRIVPILLFIIINCQLSAQGRVKIHIFNSLGEKITTLVDEWQEVGSLNSELRITDYYRGCIITGYR